MFSVDHYAHLSLITAPDNSRPVFVHTGQASSPLHLPGYVGDVCGKSLFPTQQQWAR